MRTIFLNCWYGQVGRPFFSFFQKEAERTTLLCLIEVSPQLFIRLKKLLPDFQAVFKSGVIDQATCFRYGQAVFCRPGVSLTPQPIFRAFRSSPRDMGFIWPLKVEARKIFWVVNVHGKALPGQKFDTPARIKQSQLILNYLQDKEGPKIIGGDFNLLPETKSLGMLAQAGYRNLITEFRIKKTRNRLAWENFKNHPGFVKQYFADYVFVSPEVKVRDFQVPDLGISDHEPLVLDFTV